jgi:hypothetical protein
MEGAHTSTEILETFDVISLTKITIFKNFRISSLKLPFHKIRPEFQRVGLHTAFASFFIRLLITASNGGRSPSSTFQSCPRASEVATLDWISVSTDYNFLDLAFIKPLFSDGTETTVPRFPPPSVPPVTPHPSSLIILGRYNRPSNGLSNSGFGSTPPQEIRKCILTIVSWSKLMNSTKSAGHSVYNCLFSKIGEYTGS